MKKKRVEEILQILRDHYGDAKCSLDFKNPFQLLIATILSAQCTDERVNKVTPDLFEKFPDANSMSRASLPQLEKLIQSTGFFRQKAKSLSAVSKTLTEQFQGNVPDSMEALHGMRGVGRKTANVVLGNAYGKPDGIVVDTHVSRLSQRLGFTENKAPEKIEKDLNRLVPPSDWVEFPHWMIQHGRRICKAQKPLCLECPLLSVCPRIGLPKLNVKPKAALTRAALGK